MQEMKIQSAAVVLVVSLAVVSVGLASTARRRRRPLESSVDAAVVSKSKVAARSTFEAMLNRRNQSVLESGGGTSLGRSASRHSVAAATLAFSAYAYVIPCAFHDLGPVFPQQINLPLI